MTATSAETSVTHGVSGFAAGVRELIGRRMAKASSSVGGNIAQLMPGNAQLMPGKMLRTRLASRLMGCPDVRTNHATIARICAATEMAHTARLCHDDVIDGGLVRRGRSALWRITSASGAVLIGDILLCEAMNIVCEAENGRYVMPFVQKLREVCAAEAEQELELRGRQLDEQTCLRLARGKTGPLFAFVALVCAGDDSALCETLEEAGYLIGAACQLADDLLDVAGDEAISGKTLGTDGKRGKFTLAQASQENHRLVKHHVSELCRSALDSLSMRPGHRRALAEFLRSDLGPVFNGYGLHLKVCAAQTP